MKAIRIVGLGLLVVAVLLVTSASIVSAQLRVIGKVLVRDKP